MVKKTGFNFYIFIIFVKYKNYRFKLLIKNLNINYYMYRKFIKKNITSASILLFLMIFILIQSSKPSFIYEEDGSFRQFGLGYKKKTVIPIWLITIFLAILCYVFILYYITLPRYTF